MDEDQKYFVKDGLKIQKDIPLPKDMHIEIGAEILGKKDVFVVGDVHGCLQELKDLLKSAKITRENTIVICCGDVVNKGPLSEETLRFVKSNGIYTVRGNHEDAVIDTWLKMQKGKWKKEKRAWVKNLDEEEIKYIMELPYTISIPSLKAVIVHAGIKPPLHPLEKQHPLHMVTMRNVLVNKENDIQVFEETGEGQAWGSVWQGPEHIYFGHDARRNLQTHPYATGLDSRCVYGGKLTGVYLTGDKKKISVNARAEYVVK